MADEVFDKEIIERAIIDTAKELFKVMVNPPMTDDPVTEECDVIEYQGRMRVTGLEKFHAPCHIVARSYFISEEDREKDRHACGALTISIKENATVRLLNGLGQKDFDEDDPDAVLEACGQFCGNYSEAFTRRLASSGYATLIPSEIITSKNSITEGVNFPFKQYRFIDVQFQLWRDMNLVISAIFDPSAK